MDANGADAGPAEVARAAAEAVRDGLEILLFGPGEHFGPVPDGVRVIDAPLSIAKAPDPARAVRRNPDASVVQAWRAVAEGRADAVVSGGSTGAALAAGLFSVKRARGIHRPALAILVPVPGRPFLLLDAGANVEVRPEHLVQFAHMGAAFMETALGVVEPRVALLSNGTEPERGRPETLEAHAALAGSPGDLNFVGNVEGFAVGTGAADVIVCDGFTGNVALKVMEGTSAVLLEAVRAAALSSLRSRLGGLLLKPALSGLRADVDPERQGGAVLLGLRRPGVIPHGSFSARGFTRAIEVAVAAVAEDLAGRTHARLAEAGALRRPGAGEASEPAASLPATDDPSRGFPTSPSPSG
ncbi:MAG: Phosphate:acyl-ACP acyltransferase PlsX (EC [uncultured Solirubrobacteraceae bacterium]|uniref:Phosphate acyltransferase n=1 Tax=uncultured Solirubrobacteraceae bacterium TaxID=1162706 RepID=A0A6J4RDC8_9ACTN|nr:MAG: Phosphate:acyl-ACP acyltransferase PlsX (EC [uncultured Solirubrobacteraceae bacterium]